VPIRHLHLLLLSAVLTLVPSVAAWADEDSGALSFVTQIHQSPPAVAAPAQNDDQMAPLLHEVAQDDLWQRIRNGFSLAELDSPLIAKHEQWYANRPDYVSRMTERAGRYLYFILEEVEKRGMPTEVALLPMIESAYNPSAYSIANASGIWQFIPSTGKDYGMKQNWWYDGRRDILSATRGALDYLQRLHDMFGDWQLALAAYNWGEGAVQRAQERNRARGLPTDYASLTMPEETRNYIPKLVAVKNIIASPWNFGLTLSSVPNQPYFTAVTTTEHMDVKVAAKLANISMEEFLALNPAHNRPVMLQHNTNTILLPVDKVDDFYRNLEHNDQPLVSWQGYQTRKGERLDKLAPRFGLTVEKLISINGLSARAKTSSGQTLLVPMRGGDADYEFEAFNMHLAPNALAMVAKTSPRTGKDNKGKVKERSKLAALGKRERPGKHGSKVAARREAPARSTKLASLSRPAGKPSASRNGKQPARRLHVASNP
jgi:membrane-bound lytic murein transglycosylase D